jgi:spore germination cell wall hydrolase CwlJ-like protein
LGRQARVIQFGAVLGTLLWAAALFLPFPSAADTLGLGHGSGWGGEEASSSFGTTKGWFATVGRDANESEFDCLARNIYWESKGEPALGQIAVAAVTLNRVGLSRWGDSICEVVKQRQGGCQFSWVCSPSRYREPRGSAWAYAKDIAATMLYTNWTDPTEGALYFHATYVRPSWSYVKPRAARFGNHIFYRDPVLSELLAERSPS